MPKQNRPLVSRQGKYVELISRAGPNFIIFTQMTPAEAIELSDWLRERAMEET